MREDEMRESPSKLTSISLPKRDELLLRTVFALPNASRIGLASSTCDDEAQEESCERGKWVVACGTNGKREAVWCG